MCDFVEKEKIGLIIKQGIRVKLTIRVRLKLGQTFASGLTLINKRYCFPLKMRGFENRYIYSNGWYTLFYLSLASFKE